MAEPGGREWEQTEVDTERGKQREREGEGDECGRTDQGGAQVVEAEGQSRGGGGAEVKRRCGRSRGIDRSEGVGGAARRGTADRGGTEAG